MSNYFIGIGGTGAKCAEAFTHLSAAGLMGTQTCKMFFVDQDRGNGLLGRALRTLASYSPCRQMRADSAGFFGADLVPYSEKLWTPLPEHASRSLESFFGYTNPSEQNRCNAHLLDVLFTPKQIALQLDEGFRGNPAIGAAIMGATVDLKSEHPWAEFYENLQEDAANRGGASVVLVGSIFGGTGASGIPTIAKLIKSHLQQAQIKNVSLGAILVLPYFSFGEVRNEEIQANAKEFLPASQAALQYYHDRRYLDFVDAVYLLGEQSLSFVPVPSLGGGSQANEPHPIEIYTALAAIDFFVSRPQRSGCLVAARNAIERLDWNDFPAPVGEHLRIRVGSFIRFAYAFLATAYPTLANYIRNKEAFKIAWLKNFFPNPEKTNFQDLAVQVQTMKEYCESFLLWLASMHYSARSANIALELSFVDRFARQENTPPRTALASSLEPSFSRVLLPYRQKEGLSFNEIYDALSDTRPAETRGTQGLSQLVNQLYILCGKGLN